MIAGNAPPAVCGIGDYTVRLAGELGALGVPVTVWTREGAPIRTLATRIERERPAVVHLQYEADSFDGDGFALWHLSRTAKRVNAALVTTLHALNGPRSWGRWHRLALLPALALSDEIVVCSQRQWDGLRHLPGMGAKTCLIPVGSAVPVTGTRHERANGEPLRLVYFGFVWRGRNIEMCLEALRNVRTFIPATLTIIGGVKDAAYRAELETRAAVLGVADALTFTGELPAPTISQHLADADIALLPYPTGVSTGRTTFAAAVAHEVPVITTVVSANLDLKLAFEQDESFLAVPPGDSAAFVQEAVRLAADSDLRARLRRNAPAPFAWEKIARLHTDLPAYRNINP